MRLPKPVAITEASHVFAGLPYEQQNMTPGTSQRAQERALDDSVRQRFINLADFTETKRLAAKSDPSPRLSPPPVLIVYFCEKCGYVRHCPNWRPRGCTECEAPIAPRLLVYTNTETNK